MAVLIQLGQQFPMSMAQVLQLRHEWIKALLKRMCTFPETGLQGNFSRPVIMDLVREKKHMLAIGVGFLKVTFHDDLSDGELLGYSPCQRRRTRNEVGTEKMRYGYGLI